jgi:hypothetical protein
MGERGSRAGIVDAPLGTALILMAVVGASYLWPSNLKLTREIQDRTFWILALAFGLGAWGWMLNPSKGSSRGRVLGPASLLVAAGLCLAVAVMTLGQVRTFATFPVPSGGTAVAHARWFVPGGSGDVVVLWRESDSPLSKEYVAACLPGDTDAFPFDDSISFVADGSTLSVLSGDQTIGHIPLPVTADVICRPGA